MMVTPAYGMSSAGANGLAKQRSDGGGRIEEKGTSAIARGREEEESSAHAADVLEFSLKEYRIWELWSNGEAQPLLGEEIANELRMGQGSWRAWLRFRY